MINSNDYKIFKFDKSDNCIIVENTHNTMGCKYKSYIRDSIDYGAGDTPEEAALNIAENLRKIAFEIESSINKKVLK